MAEKKKPGYNPEDIIRYHSGKMSNSEMHSLEKASLEDLFLADAIEGYMNTKTAREDIEEINQRISEKEEKKKVIPIKRFDNVWIRIAALLIVILGIGYYTYLAIRKPDSIVTARNIDITSDKKDQVIIVPKKDTISPSEVITAQETEHTRKYKEKPESISIRNKKDYESHSALNKKADTLNEVAKNEVASSAPQSDNLKENKPDFRDSGITAMRMKVASPSKAMRKDNIPANGISARDYSISTRNVKNNSIKDTTLNAGSESFKGYVDENKNILTHNGVYKGNIILSFKVNKKGRPEKIKVEQSLCTKCDEQAIILLQKGPNWEYSKGKRKRIILNLME